MLEAGPVIGIVVALAQYLPADICDEFAISENKLLGMIVVSEILHTNSHRLYVQFIKSRSDRLTISSVSP
jgi:hypothetical protein